MSILPLTQDTIDRIKGIKLYFWEDWMAKGNHKHQKPKRNHPWKLRFIYGKDNNGKADYKA